MTVALLHASFGGAGGGESDLKETRKPMRERRMKTDIWFFNIVVIGL
jgi:hypothetical protein